MRRLLLLLSIGGVLAALGFLAERHLPPEWDPREPLDLTAEPNAMTPLKLRWLSQSPQACFAAFDGSGVPVSRVRDQPSDTGCEIENAVRLPASLRTLPAPPVVTCPLAASWVLFERRTVQQAARQHLNQDVTAIRHLGTYACRNVNHAAGGRRSQHATANAIDIAGFVLRDGREISLIRHWDGTGAEAAFLRSVRDGACRWFRAALGPAYNAAHRDHFHLDMGRWSTCR